MSFYKPKKACRRYYLHPILIRFLASCLLVAAVTHFPAHRQASAAIVLSLTLQDLVQQADLIVLGRCGGMRSAWDAERKRIFTYVTVVPERCLKSGECPYSIQLRVLGGTVDDAAMTVAGTPKFHVNEGVILFLKKASTPYYQVLGLSQGKFSVIRRGNASYVTRDLDGLTLAKKMDGKFHLEQPREPEGEGDLDAFLNRIESYLGEK